MYILLVNPIKLYTRWVHEVWRVSGGVYSLRVGTRRSTPLVHRLRRTKNTQFERSSTLARSPLSSVAHHSLLKTLAHQGSDLLEPSPMALLRALRRALPALSSPAAVLPRRAPHPLPPPPAPRRFLDPIGLRSFSAAAATASQAPPMGATLFGGLMDTRFPKRRPGFANRRKRASLRPKGVEEFSGLSFLAVLTLRSG
jgi:hypothetical protein